MTLGRLAWLLCALLWRPGFAVEVGDDHLLDVGRFRIGLEGPEVVGERPVLLGAADTFRAAAADQLQTWAERVGVDIVSGQSGADPASVAYDSYHAAKARGAGVVMVDTAGRLHSKSNLMDELGKVARVLRREAGGIDEVLLVLDGTTGQNAIAQAQQFREAVDVTGLMVTKLDGTAKGGVVLGICDELGVPIRHIGIGEGIDDLRDFEPKAFVDALSIAAMRKSISGLNQKPL